MMMVANTENAYVLSDDGLLSYFDTNTQQILWRKNLVSTDTKMRYLEKNLLVTDRARAFLFNTSG